MTRVCQGAASLSSSLFPLSISRQLLSTVMPFSTFPKSFAFFLFSHFSCQPAKVSPYQFCLQTDLPAKIPLHAQGPSPTPESFVFLKYTVIMCLYGFKFHLTSTTRRSDSKLFRLGVMFPDNVALTVCLLCFAILSGFLVLASPNLTPTPHCCRYLSV